MFAKKKISLENLLVELSTAKKTFESEQQFLNDAEDKYLSAHIDYLRYKHAYEASLLAYTRYGGSDHAERERSSRALYLNASKKFDTATSNYNEAKKRAKKAKRIYRKLQKLVSQKEDYQLGL